MNEIEMKNARMKPTPRFLFAETLKRFRLDAGLSQHELARRAAADVAQLCGLERARIVGPSEGLVEKFCVALALGSQQALLMKNSAEHDRVMKTLSKLLSSTVKQDAVSALVTALQLLSTDEVMGLTKRLHYLAESKAQLLMFTRYDISLSAA